MAVCFIATKGSVEVPEVFLILTFVTGRCFFVGNLSANGSSLASNYEILLPLKAFSCRIISQGSSFWLH